VEQIPLAIKNTRLFYGRCQRGQAGGGRRDAALPQGGNPGSLATKRVVADEPTVDDSMTELICT